MNPASSPGNRYKIPAPRHCERSVAIQKCPQYQRILDRRVVSPLKILPVISMGAALLHSFVSLGVLLIAFGIFNGYLHWTAVLAPLVVLPLVILTRGLVWMLASWACVCPT